MSILSDGLREEMKALAPKEEPGKTEFWVKWLREDEVNWGNVWMVRIYFIQKWEEHYARRFDYSKNPIGGELRGIQRLVLDVAVDLGYDVKTSIEAYFRMSQKKTQEHSMLHIVRNIPTIKRILTRSYTAGELLQEVGLEDGLFT